jgi:hypothetical protein
LVIDTFIIYESSIGGSGSTLSGVVGFVTLVCPSPETRESTKGECRVWVDEVFLGGIGVGLCKVLDPILILKLDYCQ